MPESSDKNKASEKSKRPETLTGRAGHALKGVGLGVPAWLHSINEPKCQRWALIIVTALVAAFMMAPRPFRVYSLTVGEPAQETIMSPITFQVIDEAATNKNRDEVLKSIRPVYDFDDEMVHDIQARINSAFNFGKEYLTAEAEHNAKEADKPTEAPPAQVKPGSDPKSFRVLDETALRTRFENLLGATVSPTNFALLKSMGFDSRTQRDLGSLVVPVLLKGVALSRDLVMRDGRQGILLKTKSKDKLEPLRDLSAIFDLKEAINFINVAENDPFTDSEVSRAIRRIAMDLVNVNITYNRERSAALKQEALASEKKVYFQIAKGEPIVKEGEPVNEAHVRKLAGLNKANPAYSRYVILAGFALILILLLRLSFYFSEKHLDRGRHATEDLLLFCLLLIGTIIVVRFMCSLTPLMGTAATQGISQRSILFAAPVATGSMLAALMVDARIAFIFATLTALTASLSVCFLLHFRDCRTPRNDAHYGPYFGSQGRARGRPGKHGFDPGNKDGAGTAYIAKRLLRCGTRLCGRCLVRTASFRPGSAA